MTQAIALAIQNVREGKGGPFAALVVKDAHVIAKGTNLVTSTNDPTAHAEIVAIREACKVLGSFQLKGCEIYTTSEPCPMCMGAIYWARLERVYYACTKTDAAKIGFSDSFIYDQFRLPPEERSIAMHHFMREDALAAFREWEQKEDKVLY
ncbi:MAG: nucleoside deaminase [Chlorobiales bacterium]|jgi:guanine deaminase|nr:nucleoside deaminase [Chlorobiales bacterium]